jgi:hypothetical protein
MLVFYVPGSKILNVVEEAESQGKKEGLSNRKGERKRSYTDNWSQSAPS